jgi:inosine-uridine nucleoside N-ribohydrolase
MPGTPEQIGLVQNAIKNWFGRDIPVGAHNFASEKQAVSGWHSAAYGKITPATEAYPAVDLILEQSDADTVILTGGPPKNLSGSLKRAGEQGRKLELKKAVVQGGFAGEGVVPPELQMEKFRGLASCPSFNLNGDPKGTLQILAHDGFGRRYFVSKNVCHRLVYDNEIHELVGARKDRNKALNYIWQGMDFYLRENALGKIMHDILAAVCAIEPDVASWAEIELYREKGGWGSRLAPGTNTFITVDYDHQKFLDVFLAV